MSTVHVRANFIFVYEEQGRDKKEDGNGWGCLCWFMDDFYGNELLANNAVLHFADGKGQFVQVFGL